MIYDNDSTEKGYSEAEILRKEFREALVTGKTKVTKNGIPAIRGRYV